MLSDGSLRVDIGGNALRLRSTACSPCKRAFSAAAERIAVPATACPRIPAAFLVAEARRLGDYWYQQEFRCPFMDTQAQLLPSWAIQGASSDGEGVTFDEALFAP